MLDYNLKGRLVQECLDKLSALDVKTTIDCGYTQGQSDPVLINKGTVEQKRLLLTRDMKTIDEKKYKPCTHGGIIIIKHGQPTPEMICDWMKAFIQSGKRAYAKGHVTFLTGSGFTIHTHHPQPITGTFR